MDKELDMNKIPLYDFEKEELIELKDRLQTLHDDLFKEGKYHAAGYLIADINRLGKRLEPENYK